MLMPLADHVCHVVRNYAASGAPLFGRSGIDHLRFTDIVSDVTCYHCVDGLARTHGILRYHSPPLRVHYEAPRQEHCCYRVLRARAPHDLLMSHRLSHVSCSACRRVLIDDPILRNQLRAADHEAARVGAHVELWSDTLEDEAVSPDMCLDHAAVLIDERLSQGRALRWVCVTTPTRDAIWSIDPARALAARAA